MQRETLCGMIVGVSLNIGKLENTTGEWMKNRSWKKGVLLAAASIAAAGVMGCQGGEAGRKLEAYDKQYLTYFDTITSVTIYAENEEQFQAYEQIVSRELERYHQLFDIYENYEGINNIKSINDSAGVKPVQVDEDIIDLLGFSLEQYEKTDGKLDVAMGSVLSVWHDYREQASEHPEQAVIPDQSELLQAAEHMDTENVVIDKEASAVYLKDPEMRLDVGAVAKGYAAQKLAETLKEEGVEHALLSLGGNVVTIGTKGDGKPWRVGVQNPDLSSSEPYLHVVDLEDMSLVTSGTYQRFYEVDGKRYHHIINPDTLMPWDAYQAVTILTPDSALADALSTAVFNMELDDGMELIESLENTEALWVLPDGREVESSGFGAFIEE